jgi:outer membrane protein
MAGPRRAVAVLLAASLSACAGEESDRWLYEKLVYEQTPEVGTRNDAAGRFRRLGGQPKLGVRELYEMALYRSEVLALTGEELVRVQTLYEQIRGSILPRVTFDGSWTRTEKPPPATGVQQSLTLYDRTEYRFTANQPIFSGLREFYALRQTGALYRAGEHQVRHARLLLYADTADAFYAVLEVDRELATTQDTLRLAQERLEELEQRNRVGISRRSEVLSQEAEVASIRATVERLKGLLAVAWEGLRFVTGLEGAPALNDDLPDPAEVPPVEDFLARARERRDDLKAARERVAAAEEGIGIARSGYLPTADLEARYFTHREGVSAEIDWDVVLSFQVPVFEGLVTQAQIREARSLLRSSTLDLQRMSRDTALQVNRAYADLLAFRSELASLESAVAAAQETYEIVQAEYRRGIVTNIDVLTAFDQLQQARLRRDRARFGVRRSGVRLEVVTGATPGVAR